MAGRKPGATNLATRERQEAALAALRAVPGGDGITGPPRKLAKDVLSDVMHHFLSLAALHQPAPAGKTPDPAKFSEYLDKAGEFAAKLAPYQSPRLAAIAVSQAPFDISQLEDDDLERFYTLITAATARGPVAQVTYSRRDSGGDNPAEAVEVRQTSGD